MKLTFKLLGYIIFIAFITIIPSIMLLWNQQKEILMDQAYIQARTLFKMIVITRQWVSENHSRVPLDPAVVTREISEYASVMSDFRIHLTSEKYVNPKNAPDDFEIRALKSFTIGKKEYEEISHDKKLGKVYRYMAPLYVNNACLSCHKSHGYEEGDLRGGVSITLSLSKIEDTIASNNMYYYIIGLGILFGIIVTFSLLIQNQVLRHIKVFTNAASRVISGDYGVKTNIKSADEIQDLSEAFDMMSETILKNEENLINRLDEATSKYKDLVDILEEKNDELQSVNSFKTDILDSISHEIRTPLTKILSYAELLKEPNYRANQTLVDSSVESIRRNSKHLNKLFNEIITLSRLEHKQHKYSFLPVKIANMIQDVIIDHEYEINQKNLKVELEINENIMMCLDAESFHYVLNNLVSNAVKYNRKDGIVKIEYSKTDDFFCISVYDSGVGIPKEDIDKISSRFYRSENVKRDFSGTGLGLSIVSRVLEAHSGNLIIESELGVYSRFTACIPCLHHCSD